LSGYRVQGTGYRVFVLDTIGQLNDAYFLATVVFVGGSLIKHGGQNPIEPAAMGKAVIFGPHMFNFKAIAAVLLANGAAVQVSDAKGLLKELSNLLNDREKIRKLSDNARKVVRENRGATERNLKAIDSCVVRR